ncbi:hypothetical protein LYNGBM3L_28320 [Moorena producens 3L]|uniref:Uncharacterized protein n=1 Tax=Moorena producens 3L TaxID=489825 RepID=F4XP72_9CYAN|nr:hypothetical protein LYNGBM3L_28320 [Moorena producens 3L]
MVNLKLTFQKKSKILSNMNKVINRILSKPITNHPGNILDLIHWN